MPSGVFSAGVFVDGDYDASDADPFYRVIEMEKDALACGYRY